MTSQDIPPLEGRNIVVFDCEIKNVVDNKNITWKCYDKMGISVAVAFHYADMQYHVFMDDNLGDLAQLIGRADLVSGFNIDGFDIPLIINTEHKGSSLTTRIDRIFSYDLLHYSRRAAGWDWNKPFPKNMRLDHHLEFTFGESMKKTENGADAPGMYQRGEIGRLTSYCIADVHRERMLFERAWKGEPIGTKEHGWTTLELPWMNMPVVTT